MLVVLMVDTPEVDRILTCYEIGKDNTTIFSKVSFLEAFDERMLLVLGSCGPLVSSFSILLLICHSGGDVFVSVACYCRCLHHFGAELLTWSNSWYYLGMINIEKK